MTSNSYTPYIFAAGAVAVAGYAAYSYVSNSINNTLRGLGNFGSIPTCPPTRVFKNQVADNQTATASVPEMNSRTVVQLTATSATSTSSSQALTTSSQTDENHGPQVIVSLSSGNNRFKFNIPLNQFPGIESLFEKDNAFKVSYSLGEQQLQGTRALTESSTPLLTGSQTEEAATSELTTVTGVVLNIGIETADGKTVVGQLPLSQVIPEQIALAATQEWKVDQITIAKDTLSPDTDVSIRTLNNDDSELSESFSGSEAYNSAGSSANSGASSLASSSSNVMKAVKKPSRVPTKKNPVKKANANMPAVTKPRTTAAPASQRSTASKPSSRSTSTSSSNVKFTLPAPKPEYSVTTYASTSTTSSSNRNSSSLVNSMIGCSSNPSGKTVLVVVKKNDKGSVEKKS